MYEHPVLLQLSVMIDIKLSFLGLWHQVQTYLSYCQLPTLLFLAWVCPWDTVMCGTEHCYSIRDSYRARSWQSALSNGCSLPKHTSGASISSCTRQEWPLIPQYILFIIHVGSFSTFFFSMDNQWESCRKCDSLTKKKFRKRKETLISIFTSYRILSKKNSIGNISRK